MSWYPDPSLRRIVCAAVLMQHKADASVAVKLVAPRHWDAIMHMQHQLMGNCGDPSSEVQGFIDQFGDFWDREEAFVIATRQGQIRKKTGNPDSRELFSEDLY